MAAERSALLGQGAYGKVFKKNQQAVKSFAYLSHLVQELVASKLLEGSQNIVTYLEHSTADLTVTMKLYDTDLRKLLLSGLAFDRWELARQVLTGVSYIHSRGFVHGDLKPNNILVKLEPLEAVVADLGFLSLGPYSKVKNTAPKYQEPEPRADSKHDLYSLALFMTELLTGVDPLSKSLAKLPATLAIKECFAEQAWSCPEVEVLLRLMTSLDRELRPSAYELLRALDGAKLRLLCVWSLQVRVQAVPAELALGHLIKLLASEHKVPRPRKVYQALLLTTSYRSTKHAQASVYVASCVFSSTRTSERLWSTLGHCLRALEDLLNTRGFLLALVSPHSLNKGPHACLQTSLFKAAQASSRESSSQASGTLEPAEQGPLAKPSQGRALSSKV